MKMTGSSGARRVDTANLLWYHEEILALIQVWSDPKIQKELLGSIRNSRAYGKIAEHLRRVGFSRTAQQCRDKVKKMKQEYRKMSESGRSDGRKRFRYFHLIERIMVMRNQVGPDEHSVTAADIGSITCDVTIKIGNLPRATSTTFSGSTLPDVVHTDEQKDPDPDFASSNETAVRQVTASSKIDGESPSKKGRKRRRQDFQESILRYLSETQKNYLDFEKEMHRREVEAEMKRREEERQHETRLLEIMSKITATLLKGMNGPT